MRLNDPRVLREFGKLRPDRRMRGPMAGPYDDRQGFFRERFETQVECGKAVRNAADHDVQLILLQRLHEHSRD